MGKLTATQIRNFARMSFPPRCYYCRRVIRWPFGLAIFWGTRRAILWGRRRLHVAHRSCIIAHADRKLWVTGHERQKQRRLLGAFASRASLALRILDR